MTSADAFMNHQVGRRDGPGPVCEIAWRPDHNMPRMWTKRHRDHVLRNRFSQTHPGVEPILDDVDQPPLGYDFDLHLAIATKIFEDEGHQQLASPPSEQLNRSVPVGLRL